MARPSFGRTNPIAPVLIALIVATVGALIALWITGPRERRSAEPLVFAPAGIARLALHVPSGQNRLDSIFTPWDGANSVQLTRISPFWRRIRVRAVRPDGDSTIIFDAGFRCPDAAAADVERAVRELLRAHTPRTAPPTLPDPYGPSSAPTH